MLILEKNKFINRWWDYFSRHFRILFRLHCHTNEHSGRKKTFEVGENTDKALANKNGMAQYKNTSHDTLFYHKFWDFLQCSANFST